MKHALLSVLLIMVTLHAEALVITDERDFVLADGNTSIGFGANIQNVTVPYTSLDMFGGVVDQMTGINATLNMALGRINSVSFAEISTVNMLLGEIGELKLRGDENALNLYGGSIGNASLGHLSKTKMVYGHVDSIFGGLGGNLFVLGGHIGSISGFHGGTLKLYHNHGIDLSELAETATVILVDEPTTLALLAVGLGMLRSQRKRRPFA